METVSENPFFDMSWLVCSKLMSFQVTFDIVLGFEAASLREIAKEVGIQAPSLYNYIKSKEKLLYELLREPLQAMIAEYRTLTEGVTDPITRLEMFTQVHLTFHLNSRLEVFIGNMELRSLSAPHYRTITALREEGDEGFVDVEFRAVNELGDHVSGPLEAARTADMLMERGFPSVQGDQDRILVELDRSGGSKRADFAQLERSTAPFDHTAGQSAGPRANR